MLSDQFWMRKAITVAKRGGEGIHGPFGSIIVDEYDTVVGLASNSETPIDPTRHSEIRAIQMACAGRGRLLEGCTLYQTHEPCHMCCGAIKHAKIGRVVWGSSRKDLPDLFRGYILASEMILRDTSTPPHITVGVRRAECVALFARQLVSSKRETEERCSR